MQILFKSRFLKWYIQYKAFRNLNMAPHSKPKTCKFANYTVHVLPALEDNFMYIINKNESNNAFVVDPVDAELVKETLKAKSLSLLAVLTTHHHWDHAGGNDKILTSFPNVKIYGHDDRVTGLTDAVKDNQTLELCDIPITCLHTPCHTSGHICYYIKDSHDPSVFTGDTLFIGGCGRFFEGTAANMHKALTTLAQLPDKTNVFCGHEYSVADLKYGKTVEPANEAILKQLKIYEDDRKQNEPTVPSSIGLEKQINVFMRVNSPDVQKHCGTTGDPIKTMDHLRNEKNNFKG